jgi:hypothetical protein
MSQRVPANQKTFIASAAIAPHLRVKFDGSKVSVAGITDLDVGITEGRSFADGDSIAVNVRSANGTNIAIANGAVTAGSLIYTAASGKVSATKGAGALLYGMAMSAATADNDQIEFLPLSDGDIDVVEVSPANFTATGSINVIAPNAPGALVAAEIAVHTAITAHDTNFWTFALDNKGPAGTATVAMLAATDANTTKDTGGSGLSANLKRSLVLHGTAGQLAIVGGEVLKFTATKAASAADLVQPVIRLIFRRTT